MEAVELRNVWFSYDGKEYVLKGVNLKVEESSTVMVLGRSGSGKSTILKTINGLVSIQQGEVRIFGERIDSVKKLNKVRKKIGYIPQHLGLIKSKSVLYNVLLGALPKMKIVDTLFFNFSADDIKRAKYYIEIVGLGSKIDEKVVNLSGGERQRVAIARTLMQEPKLILADEFVSDLDFVKAREIMRLTYTLKEIGISFIIVTHDIFLAAEYGQKAVIVNNGRIVKELSDKDLTYQLISEAFNNG